MPTVRRSSAPAVIAPAPQPQQRPPTAPPSPPSSSFTSGAPAALPSPQGLRLEPRPAPGLDVPGIGPLSAEQADQVLKAAQASLSAAISYGRFTGASVPEATLRAASDIGAVKALRDLGYAPASTRFEDVRAELGALLDWARSPFGLER